MTTCQNRPPRRSQLAVRLVPTDLGENVVGRVFRFHRVGSSSHPTSPNLPNPDSLRRHGGDVPILLPPFPLHPHHDKRLAFFRKGSPYFLAIYRHSRNPFCFV